MLYTIGVDTANDPGFVDLMVVQNSTSAAWDSTGDGNYADAPSIGTLGMLPSGLGLVATLAGNGVANVVNAATVKVTVNGPFVQGGLLFNNTNTANNPSGTQYILATDSMTGDGLTFNNNGSPATITVACTNPSISANLTLADDLAVSVASGSTLAISGNIGESSSHSLTLSGGGTLALSGINSYSGGTVLNGGTLALGSSAALGSTGTISFGGGTLQYSSLNGTDYSPPASASTARSRSGPIRSIPTARTFLWGCFANLSSVGGSLTLVGSGTLTLSNANTSTAAARPSMPARCRRPVDNALGSGGLVANAAVSLGGNESIGTLSGSSVGGSVSVAPGTTLAVAQAADAALAGSLTLGTTGSGANRSTLAGSTHQCIDACRARRRSIPASRDLPSTAPAR